jgi:aerobic carbon-monoxide dehydrogenase large subunit
VADEAIGSLSLRFVRSPVASGRLLSIERPEGATIFTADDLRGVRPIRAILNRDDFIVVEQPILPPDRVHYAGQPIAVVVGESPAHAEDVADDVFADIEADEAVVDLDSALAADAPTVHTHVPSNTAIDARMSTDGFEDIFSSSARVLEVEIRNHRQSAFPLEARGGRACFDSRTERLTLIASVQMPHVVRTAVSDLLEIPESSLRVITPDVGGAFGQKMNLAVEDILAVWVARRLRRDVSWIEDRRENFTSAFHSRDHDYRIRGAFTESGRLIALDADIVCNVGAFSCYPVTWGVEPLMAMAELPGPYDFRHYRVRSRAIVSNTCPIAPYRGVSRPAISLCMERLMDVAASEFGLDAVEVRRSNLITSFPYRSASGLSYDRGSYVESLDMAARAFDVDAFRVRQERARDEGRYLGIGISTFSERTGYGTPAFAARSMEITPGYETVNMTMDPSGNVVIEIGASPHGQGLETSLSQLVADELGIAPSRIEVVHGDTSRTPYGWGTFASRSMVISGGACLLAARKLAGRVRAAAAECLEASSDDVQLEDGRATIRGTDRSLAISQVARVVHHSSHLLSRDLGPGSLAARATYDPLGTFSNACHIAEVEVDADTGHTKVNRFLVVEDAGRLVNPLIVDGQIHGGVAQGIAGALLEEIIYDDDGNLLTTSLMDFLPPTSQEVPDIEINHLHTITDASITGAKGVGEGGAIGSVGAVINAICDALGPLGVEVKEVPATPERIRSLIRKSERSVVA